ncbi:hypothetical protein DL95DRAFT_417065 [Leptodontidium sp. 2 PMI_412]|nr:hypothetical protein DL95DRAFT_417065 [Leptodontidium sp. 2 PMI_412]
MAPSKRNRGVTLAKSPPNSPIQPIAKRLRQKTPESSTTIPLPLRPTKLISISTPTTFNNQDLEELGPDRLDREDINESDVEIEVDEEVKISKSFCQSIIDSEDLKGSYKSKLAPLKDKSLNTRKRARRAQSEINRQISL